MSALARILLERGLAVSGCEARDSIDRRAACGRSAPTSASVTRRRTSTTPTRSSTRPRSTPGTRSSPPPGPAASRCCGGPPRSPPRSRASAPSPSPARTARPRPRRCWWSRHRHAASTRPSRSAATSTRAAATPTSAPASIAVVEADESDGSFLLTRPAAAVITNVEADHLENHGDLEAIFPAFEQFVDRIDPDGLVLTCADDAGARRVAELRPRPRAPRADLRRRRRGRRAGRAPSPARADAVEFTVEGGRGRRRRDGPRRRADRRAHGAQRGGRTGNGRRTRARRRHRDAGVGRVSAACTAGSNRTARAAASASTTTTRTTRPRSRRRWSRRGRLAGAAADRGVPAGHLQPDPDLRPRVRAGPGNGRHRRRHGHLPGAGGADPRRHRSDDQRPRRPAAWPGRLRAALRRGARARSPSWRGPATSS